MSTQRHDPFRTEHLHADLKGRAVRGGLWTFTSQITTFVLYTINAIVLARLLTPADFGLVTMVTAITGLGQSFADLGLSEATIQREDITHEQVSTLVWLNSAIGLGLQLVTVALAPFLAWFYREPRLKNIAFLLSFTFLIGGLRVQHNALLQRQMRFSAIAIRDVIGCVVAVPIGIVMALRGAGYWSIVAIPLIFNFIQTALSWIMVQWIPGPPRRDANVGSMIKFGGNVAASYLINGLNRSSDNVLIGWYWGASPLGLYSRAYNLLMNPLRQLNAPIGRVAVPAFSRLQNDPERFARYYLRALNLITWMAAPMLGFLFATAEPVINLTYGKKWLEAAPVFQFLAIAALATLLLDTTTWLFVSRGQSGKLLKLLLVMSPVFVASYAIGLPFGIKWVALSGSLFFVAMFPWALSYTFRGTQLTLGRFGRAIVCPIVVSLGGVALGECALRLLTPRNSIMELLAVAMGFAVALALAALWPPMRQEAMSLKSLLTDLRSPGPGVPSQEPSQPTLEADGI